MEERELIRRMRRGDPAALEALMDRDLAFAAGIASSILRNAPRDAEEVVVDIFRTEEMHIDMEEEVEEDMDHMHMGEIYVLMVLAEKAYAF